MLRTHSRIRCGDALITVDGVSTKGTNGALVDSIDLRVYKDEMAKATLKNVTKALDNVVGSVHKKSPVSCCPFSSSQLTPL